MNKMLTISGAINYYLNEMVYAGHSQATIKAYRSDLGQFKTYINNNTSIRYINHIKVKEISSYREFLINVKKFKYKSIKRKMDCLSAFFNLLKNYEYIDNNPMIKMLKNINSRANENQIPRFLTYEEINKIICATDNSNCVNSSRDVAILCCMAYTGSRRSDTLSLNWSDVDFEKRTIHIHRSKTRNQDILPMKQELFEALMNYYSLIRPEPDQPMFISKKGNRLSNTAFNQMFRKCVESSEIKKGFAITSHVFRHSFCTQLVQNGAQLTEIADFTGHRDLESLKVYTHTAAQQKKSILDKLPSIAI